MKKNLFPPKRFCLEFHFFAKPTFLIREWGIVEIPEASVFVFENQN